MFIDIKMKYVLKFQRILRKLTYDKNLNLLKRGIT